MSKIRNDANDVSVEENPHAKFDGRGHDEGTIKFVGGMPL
jgi:hypothetical protein